MSGDTDSQGGADSSQGLDPDSESGAESEGHASAGSTGAVDQTDEDFNRSEGSRTTGFIGKNSHITWLQKLRREQGSEVHVDADITQQSPNLLKGYSHPCVFQSSSTFWNYLNESCG